MTSSTSGQTPAVTSQTKDPWAPAQPYLQQAMQGAQGLYTGGQGYIPYTGPTQAPLDPQVYQGLGAISQIAQENLGGTPGVRAAQAQGTDIINKQGITPGIQGAIDTLGTVGGQYGDIYSQNKGNQNPYLDATIAASNRTISDKINSAMSGSGRYGSAAHEDVAARAMSEAADPILAQDYQQRQQLQLAATQGLGQTAGAIGQTYQTGINQAGQWAQLQPQLDQAQYMPAEMLQGVGQYYTNYNQNALNSQIQQYNAQQAWPWEQLSRYNAIAGGAGGMGGTSVTSATPYQAPTLQRVLGGALAGGGLGSSFGPIGAGAGALGGGIAGAFL